MEEKKLKILIGYNIKKAREKAGLTQEQLCNLISFEQPSLSQIERGNSFPKLQTLIAIILALKISADSILNFVDKCEKIETVDETDIEIVRYMLNLPIKTKQVLLQILKNEK